MKKIMLLALLCIPSAANAGCFGSPGFQTCTDSSGNSYTVNRIGNSTYVQGRNAQGESWSQDSQTIGNTTYHNGRAADGGSWNLQDTNIGGTRMITGHDSNGNSVNTYCGPAGCF